MENDKIVTKILQQDFYNAIQDFPFYQFSVFLSLFLFHRTIKSHFTHIK